ncbi:hypothetical protein WICPIJ_007235 [Wickerhamomyces pijperi]|uniref:Amino acid permease/ SLC12A domain-containing protein n=1 Tax=Wickerhamomyces pijperi TaxID=599730 RepID=A0A9P8TK48_WICPI|nr:hypothetical protein WICPIJ_007235 [Wickerhamomyces pijperi]
MTKILTALKDTFVPIPPRRLDIEETTIYDGDLSGKVKSDILLTSTTGENDDSSSSTIIPSSTQRKLKNRHVQLIGISGVIGTALFVAIGNGLRKGGPGFLLLAFAIWCLPIMAITVSTAEMVCYLPINSPFIRIGGRCIDDAFEFMQGWNFWFLQCVQIPFEIVAVNTIIHYWTASYSPAITLSIQVFLYFIISIFAVKVYGETEFWLAIGKVIMAIGLMMFTFVTMVGGNPQHDAYGFRYWKNPGSFKTYLSTGSLGYFRALLHCLIQASFTIAGPDYLAMVAGETIMPRKKTLPRAFKQIFYRLTFLFLGGCICVGTLIPFNDPSLIAAIADSKPGAAASPYVIAMVNMGIKVLPDIINGSLVLAAFSSGNAYTFCSSRTLYGLALDGKAPYIFTWCNKSGVPILAVLISLAWGLISFLQLNENSAVVLDWLINFITSCQLFNFSCMCITYIFFRRAVLAQGIDRESFTFKSWFQPYTAIFGLVSTFIMMWVNGYTVFTKGGWDYKQFLFYYLVIFIDIGLFIFWKLFKRTKFVPPMKADLVSGLAEIELHEAEYENYLEESNKMDGPKNLWRKAVDSVMALTVGKD